jgi:hypothetical protein
MVGSAVIEMAADSVVTETPDHATELPQLPQRHPLTGLRLLVLQRLLQMKLLRLRPLLLRLPQKSRLSLRLLLLRQMRPLLR